MLKATVLALCVALPAAAAPVKTALPDEVVGVSARPNPAGIILSDAIGGAIVGGAVGGAVAVCNRYCTSNGDWGDWQRDVLVGAGIGLGVGLILGGISAASQMDRAWQGPATEHREVGFSQAMGQYGLRY